MGAGLAAVGSLVPSLFFDQHEKRSPYLSVSERTYRESEIVEFDTVASTSGKLLRDCGVQEFYVKGSNLPDQVPHSLLKISPENEPSINCVLEGARHEGHPVHFSYLTPQEVIDF